MVVQEKDGLHVKVTSHTEPLKDELPEEGRIELDELRKQLLDGQSLSLCTYSLPSCLV